MAKFFIDRPVFAIVIAIVIVLLGAIAIPGLPVATYPNVVPPVVEITANYRGGNSMDLEKTVAQPIEQQLTGLDGMLYFLSKSSNNGALTIDVTFELGTDIDIATVKVQNKVSVALPQIPPEVQREGITVKKVSSAFLYAIAISSSDSRYDALFLNNFATINLVDKLGSLPGVGECRLAASQSYGMRVWVNPDKMAELGVTATDISTAVQSQNRQNPAGTVGQPPVGRGTDTQFPVNAKGRLETPEQFDNIVVRAQPDGSLLRVRDLAHTTLGAQDYASFSRFNGKPSAVMIVFLSPGANAVETGDRVLALMKQASQSFPAGIRYDINYDSTRFVRSSISEVVLTLLEAVGLVVLVVFVFLQNWRATMIPLLTVPVSIVGTFALFPLLGFSINMTSMFGLVLAIGMVVDDAIVVVEAVQHNLDEGMNPRDATIAAMEMVSGPVIAIAFILSAVFLPVAFLGGISGQIFRQFSLTIAVSVLISAFSALSLSPALSALILRPRPKSRGLLGSAFKGFNHGFEWTTNRYLRGVGFLIRRSALALVALAAVYAGTGFLFKSLPSGFLPDEDQGVFFAALRLPDGASIERDERAASKIEEVMKGTPGVDLITTFGGLDFVTSTNNSNVGTIFATLKPWDERKTPATQFEALLGHAQQGFFGVREGFTFAFGLPPILGLGTAGGFEFMLEDRTGGSIDELSRRADDLLAATRKRPELGTVVSTFRNSVPEYEVAVDTDKAQTLGIQVSDVYDSLQTYLGGLYVNDFNRFGRTWKVLMQADGEFRDQASDINRFYVRSAQGSMVPLGTLVSLKSVAGPDTIFRYNRYRAIDMLGQAAPGFSSGEAAAAMEQVAKETLPRGYSYEWTGTVFQQKLAEGKEVYTFGLAALLVFLLLAALYESWSIPFAVLLAVPLGVFGALLAVFLRKFDYDLYTQIGVVTLIGLAAKNAILIVEYARERQAEGMSAVEAAMAAARLRLRPILMTSFAFILGVSPLVVATGAGASARRALGTAVFGGMNSATLFAIFIVPVCYVVISKMTVKKRAVRLAPVAEEVAK
jgi:hydrophobe/amphiphile efflux-1 (HAE1) family protein